MDFNTQGKQLELKCAHLFSSVGWEVEIPVNPFSLKIGTVNANEFEEIDYASRRRMLFKSSDVDALSLWISPDIVLKRNGTIEGIVEIATGDFLKRIKDLYKFKKASYQYFVIITNGFVFDLYYLGRYYGQLSVPLPPDVLSAVLEENGKGEEM